MKETEQQHQAIRFVDAVFDPKDLVEIRMLPAGKREWILAEDIRGNIAGLNGHNLHESAALAPKGARLAKP